MCRGNYLFDIQVEGSILIEAICFFGVFPSYSWGLFGDGYIEIRDFSFCYGNTALDASFEWLDSHEQDYIGSNVVNTAAWLPDFVYGART